MAFSVNVENILEDFKHKLDGEDIVVLSAPYGEGKSYFLNEFLNKYTEEYVLFTI